MELLNNINAEHESKPQPIKETMGKSLPTKHILRPSQSLLFSAIVVTPSTTFIFTARHASPLSAFLLLWAANLPVVIRTISMI